MKRSISRWFGAGRRERLAVARAIEVASKALAGQLDPLLASRELAHLMPSLPALPADLGDTFTELADDTEYLPIGDERKYWAEEALVKRDVWAADIRESARDDLTTALTRLLAALSER